MIKVGDMVKCLDFPGNPNHYMCGEVLMINEDDCMMIVLTSSCFVEDKFVNKMPATFTTALPGHNMFDTAFPGRVTKQN
jgi:hypothetical protein